MPPEVRNLFEKVQGSLGKLPFNELDGGQNRIEVNTTTIRDSGYRPPIHGSHTIETNSKLVFAGILIFILLMIVAFLIAWIVYGPPTSWQ